MCLKWEIKRFLSPMNCYTLFKELSKWILAAQNARGISGEQVNTLTEIVSLHDLQLELELNFLADPCKKIVGFQRKSRKTWG